MVSPQIHIDLLSLLQRSYLKTPDCESFVIDDPLTGHPIARIQEWAILLDAMYYSMYLGIGGGGVPSMHLGRGSTG